MWKCSKCETLNDGENCTVCGEPKGKNVEIIKNGGNDQPNTNECQDSLAQESVHDENIIEEAKASEAALDEETDDGSWLCPVCQSKCKDDVCPFCGSVKPIFVEKAPKKMSSKKIIASVAIALVVILLAGGFVYYQLKKNVKPDGENGTITYENIKNTVDSVWSDDVALIINGNEVSQSMFNSFLSTAALDYQYQYCSDEYGSLDEDKLSSFKWTDIADKETGETHQEKAIADAVNRCVEYYAITDFANKNNMKISDDDKKAIEKNITDIKENYGDDLDKVVKMNGYNSFKQLEEHITFMSNTGYYAQTIEKNVDKYLEKDTSVYNFEDPKYVTFSYIVCDDKSKAKEALKKAKKAKDFKELASEYSIDGQESEDLTAMKGMLPEALEDAAFKLKIGEISDIIEDSGTYYILKRNTSVYTIMEYLQRSATVRINDTVENAEIKVDYKEMVEYDKQLREKQAENTQAAATQE